MRLNCQGKAQAHAILLQWEAHINSTVVLRHPSRWGLLWPVITGETMRERTIEPVELRFGANAIHVRIPPPHNHVRCTDSVESFVTLWTVAVRDFHTGLIRKPWDL